MSPFIATCLPTMDGIAGLSRPSRDSIVDFISLGHRQPRCLGSQRQDLYGKSEHTTSAPRAELTRSCSRRDIALGGERLGPVHPGRSTVDKRKSGEKKKKLG